MKIFKHAVAARACRRNFFKVQRNCLPPKGFFRNDFLLFLFYIIIFPAAASTFAQGNKNDSLTVGSAAPTFFLKNLDGEEFYLSNYCGKLREPWKSKKASVVLLSFFATWCAPCLKEITAMEEIAARFTGTDLKVFIINVNEKPELVTPFVKKHQIKFPILMDTYGLVASKYGATKLPRYVLINQDGKIVLLGKGYTANFKEQLRQSLSLLFGNIGTNEVRLAQ